MTYAHDEGVKLLYGGYTVRGVVLVPRTGILSATVYLVAVNPPEQELQELLVSENVRKVDAALLHYFDLTYSNPFPVTYSKTYRKYMDYFLLEIEEGDIIGKLWKPTSGNWEGWVIKDE